MSKNTKIIAAVGGVLIIAFVLVSALTKGGCGGAMDVWSGMLGCGGKTEKAAAGGASSRNFCVRNPDHPSCKKGGGEAEEDPIEEEGGDAPAEPARPAAEDAPAPADD
jgi:hypothetical protein